MSSSSFWAAWRHLLPGDLLQLGRQLRRMPGLQTGGRLAQPEVLLPALGIQGGQVGADHGAAGPLQLPVLNVPLPDLLQLMARISSLACWNLSNSIPEETRISPFIFSRVELA